MTKTKILIWILVVVILVIAGWWIWDKYQEGASTVTELKACSVDSDCIIVRTIKGLEHIPTMEEECGCKCVTSINKKFIDLWRQKQDEFKNFECKIMCKPCALDETNSEAKCENRQCITEPK